ncbi:hypothetical protein DRQ36_00965 [bacterium]|nr:MAG: hypothetical protein DRQ36_00965 [bacterium]
MNPQEIIDKYEPILAEDPGNPYFARVGDAYLTMGNIRKALTVLTEGVKANPKYTTGQQLLAKTLIEAGYLPQAKERYNIVLRIDPANIAALWNIAEIEFKQGNLEAGVEVLRRLIVTDPSNETAHRELDKRMRELTGEPEPVPAPVRETVPTGSQEEVVPAQEEVVSEFDRLLETETAPTKTPSDIQAPIEPTGKPIEKEFEELFEMDISGAQPLTTPEIQPSSQQPTPSSRPEETIPFTEATIPEGPFFKEEGTQEGGIPTLTPTEPEESQTPEQMEVEQIQLEPQKPSKPKPEEIQPTEEKPSSFDETELPSFALDIGLEKVEPEPPESAEPVPPETIPTATPAEPEQILEKTVPSEIPLSGDAIEEPKTGELSPEQAIPSPKPILPEEQPDKLPSFADFQKPKPIVEEKPESKEETTSKSQRPEGFDSFEVFEPSKETPGEETLEGFTSFGKTSTGGEEVETEDIEGLEKHREFEPLEETLDIGDLVPMDASAPSISESEGPELGEISFGNGFKDIELPTPEPAGQEEEPEKPSMMTVTMAEIYAGQGQIDKAISIYEAILENTEEPEKRERITQRLEHLKGIRSSGG